MGGGKLSAAETQALLLITNIISERKGAMLQTMKDNPGQVTTQSITHTACKEEKQSGVAIKLHPKQDFGSSGTSGTQNCERHIKTDVNGE